MENYRILKLNIALSIALFSTSAYASPDADFYIRQKNKGGTEEIIAINNLNGIYDGILAMNVHDLENRKPVFCPPEKLALTSEQIFSIFERFVEQNPWSGKYPAALVLLNAVKSTFPCK